MKELLFDTVDKNYIKYLSKFEKHVSCNKEEKYIRSNKMYIVVIKHKNNFLKTIACNFKLLEEKCLECKTEN